MLGEQIVNKSIKNIYLLHVKFSQRVPGGECLLREMFYAGNGKWLNALQFLQAEEEYKPR